MTYVPDEHGVARDALGRVSYRVEPDGTRVYAKGHRYKPLADHERKYRRLKPDPLPEGSQHFHGVWYLPLPVLPEDQRSLPQTRPDEDGAQHELGCLCALCSVPRVQRLKRQRIFAELRSG